MTVPPNLDEELPRVVAHRDVRFDISFAIGQMPRCLVRDWAGSDRLKRETARERIIDRIAERFARYQVRGHAPMPSFGDRPKVVEDPKE